MLFLITMKKMNEALMIHVRTWMNIENILSQRGHTEKVTQIILIS